MATKYLLFIFALVAFKADNYPPITGTVNDCRVQFNYTSRIDLMDGKPDMAITTIVNKKPEEFVIKWEHADIACNNRNPCIITTVGKVPVSRPYPLTKSLILIGAALRCSTYASCYYDPQFQASLGKKISEITCYNANGETTNITAMGQFSEDFKTSILEIKMSPKTGYIIGLTNDFNIANNQDTTGLKISRSPKLNELVNRYEAKNSDILTNWIDTSAKYRRNTIYYLLDNQSNDNSRIKFASENVSNVTLNKFRSIVITPSKGQFLGFVAYGYSAK